MVPISLPELPKPSRTPGKSQKTVCLNPNIYRTNKDKSLIFLMNPFGGPYRGGYRLPYLNLKELEKVPPCSVAAGSYPVTGATIMQKKTSRQYPR